VQISKNDNTNEASIDVEARDLAMVIKRLSKMETNVDANDIEPFVLGTG
ncbi:hypothetical protein Tco_1363955, partial [Tanacetum coccineum]